MDNSRRTNTGAHKYPRLESEKIRCAFGLSVSLRGNISGRLINNDQRGTYVCKFRGLCPRYTSSSCKPGRRNRASISLRRGYAGRETRCKRRGGLPRRKKEKNGEQAQKRKKKQRKRKIQNVSRLGRLFPEEKRATYFARALYTHYWSALGRSRDATRRDQPRTGHGKMNVTPIGLIDHAFP